MQAGEDRVWATEEYLRREALGAFAHEMRTPLTAIRMVLELGGAGGEGRVVLDEELARMLRTSVEQLQQLADELQEVSRLERGKLRPATGPCQLRAAVEQARNGLGERILLVGEVPDLTGHWDAKRLSGAIRTMAEAASRAGDGSGEVKLAAAEDGDCICITISSGEPGQPARAVAADIGYGFFAARQAVLAMGGQVECDRADRYLEVRLFLPLKR